MLKYFIIKEFVPPETYQIYGDQSIALIDHNLLSTIDDLREFFDEPIIINNWHIGGKFRYRGYRPENCNIGAKHSMHKHGKACDFDIVGLSADEVRQQILDNQKLFQYIKRMETDTNWVHIDTFDTGKDNIVLFKP